jgi:hypothetical protein
VAENQNYMKGITVHWKGLWPKITELLQQRWQQNSIFIWKTISTRTVWQELHKSNIHRTAAIANPLITENNAKRHKRWHDDWKYVMWSDQLSFTLFPTSGWFMFGECPRKLIILNAWFQLWNMEVDLWWFGQQYLGILLVE